MARRFHLLKPEYLVGRVRELQRAFRLRVVLVHVDVDDPVAALGDVTALTLRSDCTLVCAWSYEARPGLAHLRRPAPENTAVEGLQWSPKFWMVQDLIKGKHVMSGWW